MSIGEAAIKTAMKWVDEKLRDHPDADRLRLINEAGRLFDLSPLEEDFLIRHMTQRGSGAE